MKKFDPVTIIIYILSLMLLYTIGLAVYDVYQRNNRIADQLEAVEPIIQEDTYETAEPEKIDDTVFESEDTMVSYAPPAVEVEEVVEPEIIEPEVVGPTYFDVPLGDDLQDYIFNVCESYGVDPAIIVAMIGKESTYRADTMGDSGRSYGLMQIQPRWHLERMKRLGCDGAIEREIEKTIIDPETKEEVVIIETELFYIDLLDPYKNVLVGIDYFAELLGYDQGLTWSLMAYNGGINYANKKTAAGEVSGYVKVVTATADELRAQLAVN
jgi:hypothetical protein